MQIKPCCLLLLLLFTMACESNPTTFQIINNREYKVSEKDPLVDGSMYEIAVFAYFNDDIAWQENIDVLAPEGGSSEMMEVPDGYDLIRVSFTDAPFESDRFSLAEGARQFVARYDTLQQGMNNLIYIDNSTAIRYIYDLK